jgi:hypothetical protein
MAFMGRSLALPLTGCTVAPRADTVLTES